jgi:predicted nucleic acid-binding protein
MYHSLANLPKRVIADTNVLLDATFVDGLARRATRLLGRLGISLILDDMTEREAESILDRLKKKLALSFEPKALLAEYLSLVQVIRVPPGSPMLATGINRADRHVVAAAREHSAWILTGDAPLVVECDKIGLPARFPWDVVMEDASQRGRQDEISKIIRVVPPTKEQGLIFARVIPGAWRGIRGAGQFFTVCEIGGLGRIGYDNSNERWVFDTAIGQKAEARCTLDSDGPWAVCASYKLPGIGKSGRIEIRAGRRPAPVPPGITSTLKQLPRSPFGDLRIGSTSSGLDYWNGHVRAIVVGPQTMSAETWKAIVYTTEGAPNPYDANALERALTLVNQLGGNLPLDDLR